MGISFAITKSLHQVVASPLARGYLYLQQDGMVCGNLCSVHEEAS